MNVSSSDVILLAHSACGVMGTIAAVWTLVEALNAREENADRLRNAAAMTALSMIGAWILGGYWYLHFYPADKAVMLNGPWPFAHTLFMETKEHLFFVTLILSLYFPIAARDKPYVNPAARKMVVAVAMLIALSGLVIEGCGAIIDHGAKLGLTRASAGDSER